MEAISDVAWYVAVPLRGKETLATGWWSASRFRRNRSLWQWVVFQVHPGVHAQPRMVPELRRRRALLGILLEACTQEGVTLDKEEGIEGYGKARDERRETRGYRREKHPRDHEMLHFFFSLTSRTSAEYGEPSGSTGGALSTIWSSTSQNPLLLRPSPADSSSPRPPAPPPGS